VKWVVCYNMLWQPSTWGRVKHVDSNTVEVEYGEDAPHWFSDLWEKRFVEFFDSEEEVRKIVGDYRTKDE
jgi:hypothetical protein